MTNRLKSKVRVTSAADVAGMESSVKDLGADLRDLFFSYVEDALGEMEDLLKSQRFDDQDWRLALFRLSHNLKGLGGSFGYQLLTDVAASMCGIMMQPGIAHDTSSHRLTVAHAKALKAIVEFRMSDSNTAEATALLAALRGATPSDRGPLPADSHQTVCPSNGLAADCPHSEVNQTYRDQPPMSEFGTKRTSELSGALRYGFPSSPPGWFLKYRSR